jgi:hypothetical protein
MLYPALDALKILIVISLLIFLVWRARKLLRRDDLVFKFTKKEKIHIGSWFAVNLLCYNIFAVIFLIGLVFLEQSMQYVVWGSGVFIAIVSGYLALQKKRTPRMRLLVLAFLGSTSIWLLLEALRHMEWFIDSFWHPFNLVWLVFWHIFFIGVYFLINIFSAVLFFVRLWWLSGHKWTS